MATEAKKRDPKKEAAVRLNWLLLVMQMKALSRLTRSPVDDVAADELYELLVNDERWERLASSLWSPAK